MCYSPKFPELLELLQALRLIAILGPAYFRLHATKIQFHKCLHSVLGAPGAVVPKTSGLYVITASCITSLTQPLSSLAHPGPTSPAIVSTPSASHTSRSLCRKSLYPHLTPILCIIIPNTPATLKSQELCPVLPILANKNNSLISNFFYA